MPETIGFSLNFVHPLMMWTLLALSGYALFLGIRSSGEKSPCGAEYGRHDPLPLAGPDGHGDRQQDLGEPLNPQNSSSAKPWLAISNRARMVSPTTRSGVDAPEVTPTVISPSGRKMKMALP